MSVYANTVQIIVNGRCKPNPGPGGYAAVLMTMRNGKPVERIISGAVAQANNQRLQLLAVAEALEALKTPCVVQLTSYSQYLVKGMTQWIANWLENGWLTSKKRPVKNSDLWQRIHAACQTHQVTFTYQRWQPGDKDAQRLHALVQQARGEQPKPAVKKASGKAKSAAEAPARPYRLMVSGSRRTSQNMLAYARRVVAGAIAKNWQIVVGDNAKGVDAAIVAECKRQGYNKVIVVGIARTPRNGGVAGGRYVQIGKSYTERDRLMVQSSNRLLAIWDGQSPGTAHTYQFARTQGKTAHLMNFQSTFA
jgi:ribonuclease HI